MPDATIVHVHHHYHEFDDAPLQALIKKSHSILFTKLETIMADLTALTAQVAETNAVIDSAVVLIRGLRDEIIAAGTDAAKLAELTAQLDAKEQELAAAVVATPTE